MYEEPKKRLYRVLKSINSRLDQDNEYSIIKKGDIVLFVSSKKEYHELHDVFYYTYRILSNKNVHVLVGKLDKKTKVLTVENAWENIMSIKCFAEETSYHFERIFEEIA